MKANSKKSTLKLSRTGLVGMAVAAVIAGHSSIASADLGSDITNALKDGKAYGDFRLRFESVDSEAANKNKADALTLRSRLGYKTGDVSGVSAVIEFEDSRVVGGVDDYNDTNGHNGSHEVVADPETTELDQGFIQFKNDMVTAKVGRQVITMDNHRFVGHVGWRQDRQTFNAASVKLTPVKGLSVDYAYLAKRNRIFGEEKDVDSKDHLFNVGYKTPFGKASAYAYLLEVDQATDNAIDTYGVRFSGKTEVSKDLKALYTAEYAKQDAELGASEADADYINLEAGASFSGVTAKLGYEMLGSDSGTYAFSTPLATLHKFNGWADQFLGTPTQGLVDISATVSGKLAGVKLVAAYHEYEADESTATVDDLGSEINLLAAKKFSDNYSAGVKYAAYSAGDIKADTNKAWVWVSAKF
jgi:hypothetical protein